MKDCDDEEILKSYVVIYTCATTRGIILDLVANTSAASFLLSFRRFCGRRGCPHEIISDNGSAFTSEMIQTFISEKGIKWHFNLAKAPWQYLNV